MTSRVTQFQRPSLFVDEQVSGPFAAFRHEHRFHAQPRAFGQGDGEGEGTRMVDVVEFRAPLGPVGRLAEILALRWYVRHLIELRNAHLKQRAEAGGHVPGPPGIA